ncbi:MAG: hypothetical protein P1U70_22280 [Saprospiraceae bacterium]|nr:hypothetical protein [Saprospiraceae bacterium]
MRYFIIFFIFTFLNIPLNAQHLHFSSYSGLNRTSYNLENYQTNQTYYSYGGRLAMGHENFQFGLEFETNLTNPIFSISDNLGNDIRKDEFSNTFYGALIRWNTSEVHAYRLGLVISIGGGFNDSKFESFSLPDNISIETKDYSKKYLGANASLGFSGPIRNVIHWELHYQFNFNQVPELDTSLEVIPKFEAIHHSIQIGLSINLVFGEAAIRSKEIINSSR